jgi:tRNA-2-methylthio-N6-dimethylallyladenosine synthase
MSVPATDVRRPRVYLETYGCQMNIADSQTVAAVLRRAGYASADQPEDADVILLNTCAIREHAEERILGRLGDLARLKNRRPEIRLGLLGCMAQHNRAGLIEKAPHLDLVAGPDSYRRLPELIGRAGFDPAVDVRLDRAETYADITPDHDGSIRAYVTAMRGCDKFCAFCVVPYVRGRERSVAPQDLLREVNELAARGVREVVLLGQTVNAYRFGETDFGGLLKMVARIDGIERIRFISPHPCDMSDSVIEAMGSEPKVQPYLHLPVQSGSNRMLASMDRGYLVEEYLKLVERLRAAISSLALSTDIIVGFHGEEVGDHEQTLALMRTVGYDHAFTFKYSVREHTRACKLGDTVGEEEKGRRLAEVIALQEATSLERNRATIGQSFPVLVEGPARRGEGMLSGKTPQFKTAIFPNRGARVGATVVVHVESATAHTLMCSVAR